MTTRTSVDAADLYVMMQREFRRRQSDSCEACYMQLPYRVDRDEPDEANWEVAMPPPCARHCQMLVEEIVEEFQATYELREEARPT
jgi:hypothetical protein